MRIQVNPRLDKRGSRKRLLLYGVPLLLLYSALFFILGAAAHRERFLGNKVKPLLAANIRFPVKFVKGLSARPPRLSIHVKQKHYEVLAAKRAEALEVGMLFSSDNDYVPASISFNGGTVPIKMRLKGDSLTHLEDRKWSFRIQTKNDTALLGIKRFSLHRPEARGMLSEWVFHKALRREGLIGLHYEFVRVSLNGLELGTYAMEGHFDKYLAEANARREGVIVCFDEDLMWRELNLRRDFTGALTTGSGDYLSSQIRTFRLGKVFEDPALRAMYREAAHLLEGFRTGELQTRDVFDLEKLAAFFALTDMMGTEHGARWHNARFYYNPVTARLEPVGFDGVGATSTGEVRPIQSLCANKNFVALERIVQDISDSYFQAIFSDPKFFGEYVAELERISEPAYLDELFTELEPQMKDALAILYVERPDYDFSREILYKNQRYIKAVLNPHKGIQAYYTGSSENTVEIKIANIQAMPAEILHLYRETEVALMEPQRQTVVDMRNVAAPLSFQDVIFVSEDDPGWGEFAPLDLRIAYRIPGSSKVLTTNVSQFSRLPSNYADNWAKNWNPNVDGLSFIAKDEAAKTLIIRPGQWTLSQDLILPAGYSVHCAEGTQITLENSAKILSYSPLVFRGTESNPIRIDVTDSTGQGLVVIGAKEWSDLDYVYFNKLSNPAKDGWSLTGAVTFYESPVDISHCIFADNQCEDALNLVRTEFKISKTLFKNAFGDALDVDFGNGTITDSSFINSGNDAIDISGSLVSVENVKVSQSGDKGISAGEVSRLTAKNVSVRDSNIGIASKDGSEVTFDGGEVADCQIGLSVYQKKSEYSFGTFRGTNVVFKNNGKPYLLEADSRVFLDGKSVKPNAAGVYDALYGKEDAAVSP